MSSRFKPLLLIIGKLAVGLILIFTAIEITGDVRDARQLFDLRWRQAWPVLIWTLLINLIATWRWQILMTQFAIPSMFFASLLKTVIIGRLVGNSTSQVLGDLGARSVYLKSQGVDFKIGGLTLLADKLFEVFFAFVVGLVFLAQALLGNTIVCAVCYPILAIVLFGVGIWILPYAPSFLSRYWSQGNKLSIRPGFLSNNSRWLLAILTMAKYLAVVLRFSFMLRFCGIHDLSYVSAFFATAWAQVGLMVGFTPGGLGFVEAGWAGALYYYDISAAAIPKFLIAQRLLIITSVILLVPLVTIFEMLTKYGLGKNGRVAHE